MKKIILNFIGALILAACGSLEDYRSNVSLVHKQDSFTYIFSGRGYSKSAEQSQTEAEKNVFEVLLFRGISGNDLQIPLVQDEKQSRENNKAFYEQFFDQRKYRNFISSNVQFIDKPRPSKGGYTCVVEFTVNYAALKSNLEKNEIIRKFGF